MNEGITAQYGFLFQKYAFVDTVISNASMNVFFTYEGTEDIDMLPDEKKNPLGMAYISSNDYIQVKSGNVSKSCWARVIGNWLLINGFDDANLVLLCENELDFNIKSDDVIKGVYKFFEDGKEKNKKSIARKVNDKFFDENDVHKLNKAVDRIIGSCSICVRNLDEIKQDIFKKFVENYCSDIKVYEKAKEKRFERFIEYVFGNIDRALEEKRKYTLSFSELMSVINSVRSEISDEKYTVNVADIKKRKKKDAEKLVKDSNIREVKQLLKVRNNTGFVTKELVKELLYKDFREVYDEGDIEISNIEDQAHTNYEDVMFEFDETPSPKEVFDHTTNKTIESKLMDSSSTYRHGCYIYLTGDEIDPDLQISWGDDDDE